MFSLDAVARYRLGRAPLVKALAQVRFPLLAHLQTLEGVAPIQERLRPTFPYMDQTHEVALMVGPTAASGSSINWVFTNDDGTKLSLAPGAATLEMGQEYEGVREFAALFRAILDAIGDPERLNRCDRLGIRYINVVDVPPGDPIAWTRWFRPELSGWVGDGVLDGGAALLSSVTQSLVAGTTASVNYPVQAQIAHGYVPAGSALPDFGMQFPNAAFLLDLDIFVQTPQPFDIDAISGQFSALHDEVDRFFYWTLTDAGREHFELEEVTE